MHNPAKASALGLSISAQVSAQVLGYLASRPEDAEEFWLSFMSGMAGAIAAHVGFESADQILGSVADIHARAKAKINQQTH